MKGHTWQKTPCWLFPARSSSRTFSNLNSPYRTYSSRRRVYAMPLHLLVVRQSSHTQVSPSAYRRVKVLDRVLSRMCGRTDGQSNSLRPVAPWLVVCYAFVVLLWDQHRCNDCKHFLQQLTGNVPQEKQLRRALNTAAYKNLLPCNNFHTLGRDTFDHSSNLDSNYLAPIKYELLS